MRTLIMATLLTIAAGMVSAKPPLREMPEIVDALFDVAVADEIRKTCPSIEGRMTKGLRYLWSLKSRANDLGYSDAEIDAYRKSTIEKARMRERGDAWLAERGAAAGNVDDLCRVGRDEIRKGSRIGGLLREK